ncbi:hypothetical protein NPIL_103201 [Nephila pilipes]|uniref:Uncharacterized protein n=1 Tax=Nephila pilipes TaxID=299642 RepID=A0A8X6PQC6_NEPPI|nr:hypothetical protein NPIL_103201 [Nephila pilipes]
MMRKPHREPFPLDIVDSPEMVSCRLCGLHSTSFIFEEIVSLSQSDIFPLAHTHRPTSPLGTFWRAAIKAKHFITTRAIRKIECSGWAKTPSPSRGCVRSQNPLLSVPREVQILEQVHPLA